MRCRCHGADATIRPRGRAPGPAAGLSLAIQAFGDGALQQRDLVVQRELEDLGCEVELGEVPPLDHGIPFGYSWSIRASTRSRSCSRRVTRSPIALMRTDTSPSVTVTVSRVGSVRAGDPSKPALQCVQLAHDLVVGSISVHPLPLGCPRDGPGASARMVRTSAVRGNSAASGRCIMVR